MSKSQAVEASRPLPKVGDRLWSVGDAASFLGLPVSTLYVWRARREGPRSYRVGRWIRYDPADLQQWLDARAS